MAWIILSLYHLIDFALVFTPLYGVPFSAIKGLLWLDIGKQKKEEKNLKFSQFFKSF